MTDDWLQRELAEYEEQWRQGYFPAVAFAFEQCYAVDAPLPDWLAEAIRDSLAFTFREGGKEGRSDRDGGHLKRAPRLEVEWLRRGVAEVLLNARIDLPGHGYEATREGAFAMAHDILKGHRAQVSAKTLKNVTERHPKRPR